MILLNHGIPHNAEQTATYRRTRRHIAILSSVELRATIRAVTAYSITDEYGRQAIIKIGVTARAACQVDYNSLIFSKYKLRESGQPFAGGSVHVPPFDSMAPSRRPPRTSKAQLP